MYAHHFYHLTLAFEKGSDQYQYAPYSEHTYQAALKQRTPCSQHPPLALHGQPTLSPAAE